MKQLIFNANYATKNVISAILGSLVYLMLSAWLIGFKTDQVFLVVLFNFLFFVSETTQRFILGFMIFIVFWIIFDFMKILPNYKVNTIHIDDLYLRELRWFGIDDGGKILTPNEYADKHSALSLDIMSGLFYLNWIPIPLLFACYLFASDKLLFLRFSLTFLLVNLLGFTVYYLYPAAPPWYVKEFGFKVLYNTPGHTGALGRFDAYFGVNIFSGLYSKSSNVFAAMPSLHCAYPIVVLYYSIEKRMGWISVLFFIFMTGIWFSAVYTGHHYVQDVLAGLICAIVGIWLFNFIIKRSNGTRSLIIQYRYAISKKSINSD
jgi:inositol phosphorylceramide synthase catalytic subunit